MGIALQPTPWNWRNKRLATGFTVRLVQELKVFQTAIRLMHTPLVNLLQQHWLCGEPDVVVSLIPNLNRRRVDGPTRGSVHAPATRRHRPVHASPRSIARGSVGDAGDLVPQVVQHRQWQPHRRFVVLQLSLEAAPSVQ